MKVKLLIMNCVVKLAKLLVVDVGQKELTLSIGHRQKHKGMSWSALGSKALAILKVTECNGQWRQTWLTQMAA